MTSNYPPGVVGSEPQIAGGDEAFDEAFSAWMTTAHPEHDLEGDWDAAIERYNDEFLATLEPEDEPAPEFPRHCLGGHGVIETTDITCLLCKEPEPLRIRYTGGMAMRPEFY